MNQTSHRIRTLPSSKLILIVASVSIVGMAAMITVGYLSSRPPEGPPIAVFDIRSGEPFEQHLASSGGNLQVWLDAECDDCSYPIEGNMRLASDGRTIESVEISAGSSKHGGWDGGHKSVSQRNVFEAETPPAGAPLTLSGVLTVHGGRDFFSHKVKKDAPPPRVRLLRLTVTR
ncbi:MAG: hypothetical protein JW940_16095 [Polyangiaceae bacterium]|nr:hypothetical protein [Polyangiaceae bacterium]